MNKVFEQVYPISAGIVLTALALRLPDVTKVSLAKELANPILAILAITVGFMVTAMALLLTAQDLPVIQRLRTSDAFNRLVDCHWEAVRSGFGAAILSLCVIVICKSLSTTPQMIVFHLWILCVAWAFAAFYRVVRLLRRLLRV